MQRIFIRVDTSNTNIDCNERGRNGPISPNPCRTEQIFPAMRYRERWVEPPPPPQIRKYTATEIFALRVGEEFASTVSML